VLIWIGPPWVVAGGALALGLEGREGPQRGRATIGLALGMIVLLLCVVGSDWQADADDQSGSNATSRDSQTRS
jgi:hypothetical protein